jgi:glycosyltransferase involved in cell wall biosynthesis
MNQGKLLGTSMSSGRRLVFANSVDYARHTGGYVYNTRLMRELAGRGWDVVPLDLPPGFPRPDLSARAQSAKLLAGLPDGVLVVADQICLSPLANLLAREAERLLLVMIFHHPVAKEEGLPADERAHFMTDEQAALSSCRLIVATSPTTAATLRADFDVPEDRIVVAPPGTERFEPEEMPPVADAPRLLSVGAVIERKGYHILVDALEGLSDTPWRLDIVGDLDRAPEYVERLLARIAVAGLADRIVLKGGLSSAELETCWRSAHAYVAASVHEGFGMAVAEAIARGLPTVTSHSGAIGEWLDPKAALIVPTASREALRTAIGRVLGDTALRARLHAGALAQAARFPSWADAADIVDRRLAEL